MIYRTALDHLKLTEAFTDIMVPLELCAMVLLALVFGVAVKYRVYTDFPGNLFLWVLVLDFCHGVFTPIRWARASLTAYNILGNPDTMSNAMCTFNAFADTFFQMGSLFTNTAIIASVFYMVFFTSDFRAHRRVNNLFTAGFWIFTLSLSLPALAYPPYRGVGWCVTDQMVLVMKQIVWASSIMLQVAMVVPTNWKIYQSSLVNVKGVSKGTYFRFCGIILTQIIGLFPTLIVEFNGMVRDTSSTGMLYLVVIGLPLGHLLDALLMSVKVLPHLFPFLHSLFSKFDSSRNGGNTTHTGTTGDDDTKERTRRSTHGGKGNSKHSGHGARHGQSESNMEGSTQKHHTTLQSQSVRHKHNDSRAEKDRDKDSNNSSQPRAGGGGGAGAGGDVELSTLTAMAVAPAKQPLTYSPTNRRTTAAEQRNADTSSYSYANSQSSGGGVVVVGGGGGKNKVSELNGNTSDDNGNIITTTTTTTTIPAVDKSDEPLNFIITTTPTTTTMTSTSQGKKEERITSAQVSRLRGQHRARCGVLTQVFWVLIFPLILLLVACAMRASSNYKLSAQSELLLGNLQLAKPIATLIHLLEEECAGTILAMDTNLTQYKLTMRTNTAETNAEVTTFTAALQTAPQSFLATKEMQDVLISLGEIPYLRAQIQAQNYTEQQALQGYGDISAHLVTLLTKATDSNRIDTIASKLFSFAMSLCLQDLGIGQESKAIALKQAYATDNELWNHPTELQQYMRSLGNQEPTLKFYRILTPDSSRMLQLVYNFTNSSDPNPRYAFMSRFNDAWFSKTYRQELLEIKALVQGIYQVELANYAALVSTANGKVSTAASELRYGVVGMAIVLAYFCIALFIMVYGIDTILRDVHALQIRHETRAGKKFVPQASKKKWWRLVFSFKARLIIALFLPMSVSFTVLMDSLKVTVDSTQSISRMIDNLQLGLIVGELIRALGDEQSIFEVWQSEGLNSTILNEVHRRNNVTDALFQARSQYLFEEFDDPVILKLAPYRALLQAYQELPLKREAWMTDSWANVSLARSVYASINSLLLNVAVKIPLIASDGAIDQQLVGYLSVIFAQFGVASQRLEGYHYRTSDLQDAGAFARFLYATGMERAYNFCVNNFAPADGIARFAGYQAEPVHVVLQNIVSQVWLNNTAVIKGTVFPEEWYNLYTKDTDVSRDLSDTFGTELLAQVSSNAHGFRVNAAWFLGGFGWTFIVSLFLVLTAQRKLRNYQVLMAKLLTYEDTRVQGYLNTKSPNTNTNPPPPPGDHTHPNKSNQGKGKNDNKDKEKEIMQSSSLLHRSHSVPSLGLGGPGAAHDPALSQLAEIMCEAHNVLPEIAHFYQWIARTDCQQRDKELHELLQRQSRPSVDDQQPQTQPSNPTTENSTFKQEFWPELLRLAGEAKWVRTLADPSEKTAKTMALIGKAEEFYARYGLQQLKISAYAPRSPHSPSASPRRSSTFAGRSSTSAQPFRQQNRTLLLTTPTDSPASPLRPLGSQQGLQKSAGVNSRLRPST